MFSVALCTQKSVKSCWNLLKPVKTYKHTLIKSKLLELSESTCDYSSSLFWNRRGVSIDQSHSIPTNYQSVIQSDVATAYQDTFNNKRNYGYRIINRFQVANVLKNASSFRCALTYILFTFDKVVYTSSIILPLGKNAEQNAKSRAKILAQLQGPPSHLQYGHL